jgi:glycine cleavage system transcriptional repressor
MSLELVVTAVGPDRPGIASDFAGHVHAAGANLADTRMVNLRGQFALLALVEGSAEVLEDVKRRLKDAGPKIGLAIEFSTPSAKPGAVAPAREGVPFRLKTYSMDQPGIVHRITSYLREQGVNVEELTTRLESAPFMGTPVFTMEILMLVPKKVSVKALRSGLEELGDTLNCDVDLDPA